MPNRQPRAATKTRRQPSARPAQRKTVRKRKRKNKARRWSLGLRYVLIGLIALLFGWTFYYFFIRPYAYRWRPCQGQKAFNTCLPYPYNVHGLDISHHQGDIMWDTLAVARQGQFPIHFIFMKATEGGSWFDKAFVTSFALAAKHGFIRGAYHFYKPNTDAGQQADHFIRHVRLQNGDLPPVLDVEEKGRQNLKDFQNGVQTWLKRVEAHYGVKPILYASHQFKLDYLNDPVFDDYPFWIAHYYVDAVRYAGKWAFWQHSDRGRVPGIPEKVDLNVFNGRLEELNELLIGYNGR